MRNRYAENREAYKQQASDWYYENQDKMIEWNRQYRETHREHYKEYNKQYFNSEHGRNMNRKCQKEASEAVKRKVYEHYGSCCAICGESNWEFLTIDHKNNDGNLQRKIHGIGSSFHYWIIRNNFPDDLQLLCYNHNCSKQYTEAELLQTKEAIKRREQSFLKRQEVLDHMGGKCECCGETNPRFLTIDHINGGGAKHKRENKIVKLYKWIKKNNYPEGFRLLCYNCNCARSKQRNKGICPHKQGAHMEEKDEYNNYK
jgi:hypothetical protein